MKKRLIIVDSDQLLRDTLAICLGVDGDYEIIGQTGSGLEAVDLCITRRPHLLILDLMLPQLCGVEVLRRLRATVPEQKVLVLTATADCSLIIDALRSRPNGFVEKPTSLKVLREAMNAVCAGSRYYSPLASELLGESFAAPTATSVLSRREREVIQLIAEGASSKEISSTLKIAVKTVENHRGNLMRKLHLHNVADVTRYAIATGIAPGQ